MTACKPPKGTNWGTWHWLKHNDATSQGWRYLRPASPTDAADLASARSEIERLKAAYFAPMGDNHHNAAACPYCNPKLEGDDLVELVTLRAENAALASRCREAEVALRKRAVAMSYDFPGDAMEECGLWCDICKSHVDGDGAGHEPSCLLYSAGLQSPTRAAGGEMADG